MARSQRRRVSGDVRDLITWVLGTIVTGLVLIGFAVRYVLMPYLRDHLVKPVEAVRKQVTDNHHANAEPTLPDRIDEVRTEVSALARFLEGHVQSSERWLDMLVARIEALEDKVRHHHPNKD